MPVFELMHIGNANKQFSIDIEEDLRIALGIDAVSVGTLYNMCDFSYKVTF